MTAMHFRVDADGVHAIHSDKAAALLRRLGRLRVTRASQVEWHEAAQAWGVWRPSEDVATVEPLHLAATRREALAWEVGHFWALDNQRKDKP